MLPKSIQDILPLIERPSRYLGSEVNCVYKDLAGVKLKFALAFPDLYEIGTSHFGMQILYNILNSEPDIAAERVFAPAEDLTVLLRSTHMPLMSLESHHPLKEFDIIGFSLLYELNYTNILTILDLSQIPFLAPQRDDSFPLIIGGGPCTCNPEPLATFFDAFVIGDGEDIILEMAKAWMACKEEGQSEKNSVLQKWSSLEGVYIPKLFQASYDEQGLQTTTPSQELCQKGRAHISRAVIGDLNEAAFPESPVVPFGKPVHDRLRLEIARGCTRGCRFCQAGMIYRPVRERSPATLLKLAQESIRNTGYEDVSLLSLSTGDYSCITSLLSEFMYQYRARNIAVSLPSLRAGTLTARLMELIKHVRKTGFTIAPEAGSQRLRDVINKNITDTEIVDTVKSAFNAGWQVIKLYFMIGLPTETEADVADIVHLVKVLRKIRGSSGRYGKLNVSVTTFIPKPHTPFQWAPQISLEKSRQRISWLKNKLKLPGIQFKWQNPEVSLLEGLWARGDRRLGDLLMTAYRNGCKFDGWSDRFDYQAWCKSFSECQTDVDFYTIRTRQIDESLPWDHIDVGVDKEYLAREWELALKEKRTPDCRWSECNQCGVCDFERIEPKTFEYDSTNRPHNVEEDAQKADNHTTIRFVYSKTGPARFFGHLELVNIILRSLRRAQIPLAYSKGFHPLPKVSFEDPLPTGMESLGERFYATICGTVDIKHMLRRLNKDLPEGLLITNCDRVAKKASPVAGVSESYLIRLKNATFDKRKYDRFRRSPEFVISRRTKKGTINALNLREMVLSVDLVQPDSLKMSIKKKPGITVRPAEILTHVFGLTQSDIQTASIMKTE
jgi:radical SAM family uncharacterized protein/radical SAM-linked protein